MSRLWTVHWVSAELAAPSGQHPLLDEWRDLVEREESFGLDPGDPFMVDPDFRVDARLTRYFGRSSFANLRKATKRSYTTDYRVFFNFLWSRGKYWDAADYDALLDFEDWRRRSPRNMRRISGSKWNRELAALSRLYGWAVKQGFVAESPVGVKTVRNRYGDLVEVAEARAKDVRSSNVKWLTPRAFRLWRDVGLRGYTAEGRMDPSWRGRHDDRNAAFADLLLSSGLRLGEGGSLLTIELPASANTPQRYVEARLAAAVAKSKRARTFYISATVLREVEAYCATTRRGAIRRAQTAGRYDALDDIWLVVKQSGWQQRVLHWRDRHGRTGERRIDALEPDERRRLFVQGDSGLEPLWLWLAEDGTPFGAHSWEAVFRAASRRCAVTLAGVVPDPPFATPHMARHSFALYMLVALHRALDMRLDLTPEERRDYMLLYMSPWRMVKDLLGHASEQVTRDIYLAPVSDLEVRSLLIEDDDPDVAELLAKLAAASERILDAEVAG
ncbi:site-specific integrase [Nocardia cyriacigeorgica]|uniref:site-specific integrase n=1 Tax=Nocardia cyriacigeorgica TaxID=135487 RepID=UPI002457872E|nr:site-specific integrase [Nocardia cyriacigeorgica]